uniref:D-aminoacyl-tRNA deacylase n=1 Tax=Thermodesulfovibrio aggregans TaxID=86166 RepID=A0A7C4AJF0_9BACT
MIVLLQRVLKASVMVDGMIVSEIGRGIVVFLGIEKQDTQKDAQYLVNKISNLRIFEDRNGKMNLSVKDINGEILIVSEFTLAGECKKGMRPSFDKAMNPEDAQSLYKAFVGLMMQTGIPTKEGIFRTFMHVSLVNEGPVTFIIKSR